MSPVQWYSQVYQYRGYKFRIRVALQDLEPPCTVHVDHLGSRLYSRLFVVNPDNFVVEFEVIQETIRSWVHSLFENKSALALVLSELGFSPTKLD